MLDRLTPVPANPIRPEQDRAKVSSQAGYRGPKVDFAAAGPAQAQAEPLERDSQAETARQAAGNAASGFPHLRRRTDLAETPQPATGKSAAIELPPHLERRRAWREAKGIGTFHAQNLAQNQQASGSEAATDAEQRAAAHGLYRQWGGRGRLDIDLAQRVSVTV